MRRICKYLGITLLTLFVSLAVILWIGSDRLIDAKLRPWAVTQAAAALNAEVHIDRLALGWGQIEASGIHVARAGEFALQVEAIAVRYTLAGLWQRRLELVTVLRPDMQWNLAFAAAEEPVEWPAAPNLRVAGWSIEDGRLLLRRGEDALLFRQLAARGEIDNRYGIEASAVLGEEPGVPLAISGYGQWNGQPELTITDIRLSDRPLLREPVTVSPDREPFGVSLALPDLDDVETSRILSALGRPSPWPPELGWQVSSPRLTVSHHAARLRLNLETAAGELRRQGERWPWEKLHLQLVSGSDGWQVEGAADLPAKARLQTQGIWRDELYKGSWALSAPAPARLGQALGLDLPTAAARLRMLTLAGELEAAAAAVNAREVRLTARLQDEVELTGSLAGRWQSGHVDGEASELVLRQGSSRLATASFELVQRPATVDWQGSWRLQVPDARSLVQALGAALPPDLPNLQNLYIQGELAGSDSRLLVPTVQLHGRLKGTGLDGQVSGQLAVRQLATGWRFELTRLAATELDYLTADGLSGVSGGALQLAGRLTWGQELDFDLQGEAAADEALAGNWYADLRGILQYFDLAGAWEAESGDIRLRDGRLDLAGLATARLQGLLAGPRLQLTGNVSVPQLAGPFQQQLRQLAAGAAPALDQLEMAGSLTAGFTADSSAQGWELTAAVRPDGVMLSRGEQIRLTGLSGELPLLLQRGDAPPVAERRSTLRWQELRAGPIASSDEHLQLVVGPNRWRLAEPLRLSTADGWLEITSFALSLPATGPQLQAALRADALDLATISRLFDWPEMGGKLTAELPDIRFAEEEIRTGGEARLQVFDGEVRLRNMRMRNPFSDYPTYHADIDFSGIDLRLLTQAFAFGEINGIADGFVHELRLFGAVPSAFQAVFETREKGKRNISVKAIKNLNTLSHGGLSAALSQGIYRFIDFYRYRKIGIRCSLRNDIFHLTGTAKPGTDTYLIYGGWLPPRLDVVVSAPTISFQEMVRRLKRIERAGR